MKQTSFLILLFILSNCTYSQQYKILEKSSERFIYVLHDKINSIDIQELSGLLKVNDDIFAIDDNYAAIYKINTNLTDIERINLSDSLIDFEGIDYNMQKKSFLLLTEKDFKENNTKSTKNEVYSYSFSDKSEQLIFDTVFADCKNAGFEGMAVSYDGSTIYLAKERDGNASLDSYFSRSVWVCKFDDDKNLNLINKILTYDEYPYLTDFTDIKYVEDSLSSYLYILERINSNVIKFDLKNGDIAEIQTFEPYDISENGKCYEGKNQNRFGKAEALLVTDSEIWVGFDGNGETFVKEWFKQWKNSFSEKNIKSSNRNSIIMKFKKF